MRSRLEPSGHQLVVRHVKGPDEITVDLLGGYQAENCQQIVLMFRYSSEEGGLVRDGLFYRTSRNRVRTPTPEVSLDSESGDWNRFALLEDGSRFRLGGRWWIKLSIADLLKKTGKRLLAS